MTRPAFRLTTPAAADAVRIIRAVANGAAADAALSYNSFEDLDLAVGEASASLLEHGSGGSLECVVSVAEGSLDVSVALSGSPEATAQWPPADWENSLGALVLGSVASDVHLVHVDGNPAISFTVV
ncbi:MAG: hypothetical protein HKN91_11225 [Acidimicrobiia bacterium]|nr:hypothetical protein [Acidimicrobiia bacterium]